MQAFLFLGFKMAKSLQDWISFLDSIDINKIKLGLERMQEMLEALDLKPYLEKTLVIEVAGTNGTGSGASFLSECLRLSGVKVGLYTSPHLKHFTERVKISGKEVAESLLCEAFSEVKSISDEKNIPLTYFEFTTLAALCCYKKEKVEVLVLEIGLGGRLDAVNAVDAKLCVIPSIGFDHMQFLGNTIEKIAFEKAGIIKDKSFVVVGDLDKKALEVIERQVQEKRAFLYKKGDYSLDFKKYHVEFKTENGDFHFEDYAIPKACLGPSLMAAFLLEQYFNFYFSAGTLQKALLSAALPCRMEKVQVGEKLVILDVAHNVPAALNLKDTLQTLYPEQNLVCVMGMLKDKDIEGVIHVVAPLFKKFYVGSLQGARGESYERIVQGLIHEQILKDAIKSYNKISEALDAALSDDNNIVIVFGSFHTASLARDELFQITSGR